MSHVKISFDVAEYTADVDGLGTLRLLDAIRTTGLDKTVKFYQASTSEMYGKVIHYFCFLRGAAGGGGVPPSNIYQLIVVIFFLQEGAIFKRQ